MKAHILKPGIMATIGLLLTLPTVYFILISLLKYGLGLPGLFDAAQPLLERWGIKETIGWNINLLILFGPVFALLLNVTSILTIKWQASKNDVDMQLHIEKKWSNLLVIALSGLCLLILFLYLFGENCR